MMRARGSNDRKWPIRDVRERPPSLPRETRAAGAGRTSLAAKETNFIRSCPLSEQFGTGMGRTSALAGGALTTRRNSQS
jgi:hypothetical protein